MRIVLGCPLHHKTKCCRLCGCRSKSDHRKLCLCQNSGGNLENEGHNNVGCNVRKDVGKDNPQHAVAGQLGKVYMVTVSKRNNLGTYGTCCPRPCGNSDQECHHHDSPLRLTYAVGDEDQENEGWDNGEQVGKEQNQVVKDVIDQKYEYGFTTDVHTEIIEKGLNEDVVRLISQKKGEPDWMLEFRLKAYNYWKTLKEPKWGHVHVPPIDYQEISYYADPLAKKPKNKEIDPELEKTFDKLGIPLEERLALSGTAVDAIMDSVSVKTTFKEKLREKGVIFCSIGEAVKEHPDLVREYLGTVVPYRDNFYAALNSCVFSDGSFVYIPKGVRCPMELSSYFRINARNTGQFERTLIIADDDAYVSYLEGCTAPMRDENQLHAAIVEIIVKDNAEVKYSTVQNWYPGDEHGKGGVLNLVTKRGDLRGVNSKLSWTQVETGSAITWKYPSCILRGDNSVAEFYSVAVTNNYQEADTGTKMIHMGKNTKSTIISKGISAGHSQNSYRGLVRATSNADNARNYSSCDSLLLGSDCGAHTFPYMDAHNDTAVNVSVTGYEIPHLNDEDFRRPALLLQSARHSYRGGCRPDRKRLCQGCAQQVAYGVCR